MAALQVLAVDTASAMTAVALVGDGVVAEEAHFDPRGHAEVLIPLVRSVLATAGITRPDVIACGVGPGPYTGLRVGIATARALSLSWSIPIVGVCSLDAVAWAAQAGGASGPVGVVMDARRREVYWATFDASGLRTGGPGVCRPSELPEQAPGLCWVGSGIGGLSPRLHPIEPPPWGPVGLPGLAGSMGLRVQRELSTGVGSALEPASVNSEVRQQRQSWLADHGSDSGATAHALIDEVILPPEPLYLRRPDAAVSRA